jgi:hypothetical protein
MVRDKALDCRALFVWRMGLNATDFQNLREELVKLRTNLADFGIGKSWPTLPHREPSHACVR